jgi:predicted DNA-binding transcriptional regulator YafY
MMRALASRSMSANELAEEFSVTRRQVYRDLNRIEEQGHPLTRGGEGGDSSWQLPLGYKGLPPIALSPYELMSLQLARADLSYLEGTPFVEDLDATLGKLRAALPDKTLNHLERLVEVFAPLAQPFRKYGAQAALLCDLRKALLLQLTTGRGKPGDLCVHRRVFNRQRLHQALAYLPNLVSTKPGLAHYAPLFIA